jgi:hypothetical protein
MESNTEPFKHYTEAEIEEKLINLEKKFFNRAAREQNEDTLAVYRQLHGVEVGYCKRGWFVCKGREDASRGALALASTVALVVCAGKV